MREIITVSTTDFSGTRTTRRRIIRIATDGMAIWEVQDDAGNGLISIKYVPQEIAYTCSRAEGLELAHGLLELLEEQ